MVAGEDIASARSGDDCSRPGEHWNYIRTETCGLDVAFIAAVPLGLVVIQSIVSPENWAFPLDKPGIFASHSLLLKAFTSSFVHEGAGLESPHLWGNIAVYIVLMTAIYPLSILAGWRERFVRNSVLLIVAVPFFSSEASVILPYHQLTLGFSGILGAFFGYLVLLLFAAGSQIADTDYSPAWSIVFVLFSVPVVLYFAPRILPVIPLMLDLIAGFGVAFVVGLMVMRRVVGWEPIVIVFGWRRNPIVFHGSVVTVIGFLGLFVTPAGENVVSHLAGYSVGYFGVLLALVRDDLEALLRETWQSTYASHE